MKIRFLTDKLPKSCIECNVFISSPDEGMQCVALQKYIDWEFDVINNKLTDCPLEVEHECEWRYAYYLPDDGYNYATGCNNYLSSLFEKQHAFCSNCGKRILYKEE